MEVLVREDPGSEVPHLHEPNSLVKKSMSIKKYPPSYPPKTRNPEFFNHTHLLYGWGHSTNGNSVHVWLCDSVIISSPLINRVFRPGLSSDKRVLQYKYNPPEPDSREVSVHKESFNCPTSTQGPLYKCTFVYLFTVSAHI